MKNGSEVGGRPGEDGSTSHVEVASWVGGFKGWWCHRVSPCLDAAEGRYGEEWVCPSDLRGHP